LILDIISSSIFRFYNLIEQIFSNPNFEVFFPSGRNAMILKMQNNKNVYYFDRTIFHSNSAISEQTMELSSDGLMNNMFTTWIYDNIWTGEEEISLQSLMAFTKGQLISEWNFGVFKSPKKPTKFLTDFCPSFTGQKSA
jgi:hypothetical protein